MNIVKVTTEEANHVEQTKKFGVISDGASAVWGQGDTAEEAIMDATKNMKAGCGVADFEDCFVMEIV